MRTNDCSTTRSEIDEAARGVPPGDQALGHIAVCAACRTFREERSALSELIGSLEAVDAPPDFNFRLRARMAATKSSRRPRFAQLAFSPATAAMVGAGLLVAVIGAFYFRHIGIVDEGAGRAGVVAPGGSTSGTDTPGSQSVKVKEVLNAGEKGEQTPIPVIVRRRAGSGEAGGSESPAGRTRSLPSSSDVTSRDFSQLPAVSVKRSDASAPAGSSNASPAIPLSAPPRPLVVSVRDDRGTMRTISLPPVSFGAQELVQSPKRSVPVTKQAREIW